MQYHFFIMYVFVFNPFVVVSVGIFNQDYHFARFSNKHIYVCATRTRTKQGRPFFVCGEADFIVSAPQLWDQLPDIFFKVCLLF